MAGDDDPKRRVRTFELLFETAKGVFEDEYSRFSDAERKLDRHGALLVAVLGAGTFMLELTKVPMKIPQSPDELFLQVLVAFFYGTGLVGLFATVRGIRVSQYPLLPTSHQLPEFYHNHSLTTVLYAMSKRYLKGAAEAREVNNRKMWLVHFASNCLALSIALGLGALALLTWRTLE